MKLHDLSFFARTFNHHNKIQYVSMFLGDQNTLILKDATEYAVFFKDISSCVYTRKVYWSDCTLWRTNIAIEQPSSSIGNTFSNWYSFNCHVGLPECVTECYLLVPISQMFKQKKYLKLSPRGILGS